MMQLTPADCFTVSNKVKQYSFSHCLAYLQQEGQKRYGQNFKIDTTDKQVILKMLVYAIRDEETARALQIDLKKGILLSGPAGCGKTALFYLIQSFFKSKYSYLIVPCRNISHEFGHIGFEALNHYKSKSALQSKITIFCFDGLGSEQQINHYGNECNVMAEIILSRYESFIENGTLTHVTTSLVIPKIEEGYGADLKTKMLRMFNVIEFEPDTTDKRVL